MEKKQQTKIVEKEYNYSDFIPLIKNPFAPKDPSLKQLQKSIKDNPKFMEIRKIVIDKNNNIQGGNKRYFALGMLGYKTIPAKWVDKRTDLTDEEKKAFQIIDNIGHGEWDLEILNDWDLEQLEEWGLDIEETEEFEGNIDDFFEDNPNEQEAKVKTIECPECGKVIELK